MTKNRSDRKRYFHIKFSHSSVPFYNIRIQTYVGTVHLYLHTILIELCKVLEKWKQRLGIIYNNIPVYIQIAYLNLCFIQQIKNISLPHIYSSNLSWHFILLSSCFTTYNTLNAACHRLLNNIIFQNIITAHYICIMYVYTLGSFFCSILSIFIYTHVFRP